MNRIYKLIKFFLVLNTIIISLLLQLFCESVIAECPAPDVKEVSDPKSQLGDLCDVVKAYSMFPFIRHGFLQDIRFAPMQPGMPRECPDSRFKHRFKDEKKCYDENTFIRTGDIKKDKVYLYVSIKADENGNRPQYIWVLIAAPAPIEQQKYTVTRGGSENTLRMKIDGFMRPLKDEDWGCFYSEFFSSNRDQWDTLHKTYGVNVKYFLNTIYNKRNEAGERAELNKIWRNLVCRHGGKFPIIAERAVRERPIGNQAYKRYDYTYLFHEIKDEPGRCGYRMVFSKTVTVSGKVYGFVFDNRKQCLGGCQLIVQ